MDNQSNVGDVYPGAQRAHDRDDRAAAVDESRQYPRLIYSQAGVRLASDPLHQRYDLADHVSVYYGLPSIDRPDQPADPGLDDLTLHPHIRMAAI